jgi:molybdenum cofactor cytidylyltransferase
VIAAIVLAAGASKRMGESKMLLPWRGGTLLSAAVGPLLSAGLARVVVVLGHEAGTVGRRAALPEDPRLRVVVNADWAEGMSSSLRRGLAECADAAAVVVALGDQPGVAPELVRALVAAHEAGAPLALPLHEGRVGHPVLFARTLWTELGRVSGEQGGRDVIRRHWREAAKIPGRPLWDVDTPEDYAALLSGRDNPKDEGLEAPLAGRDPAS